MMRETRDLSLAMSGLDSALDVRGALARVRSAGFGWVQLDASARSMRARELDRSGRRGLAALLRRLGLRASGLDLWIPAGHFSPGDNLDRAVAAVGGAIGLAGDLGALGLEDIRVVSIETPGDIPGDVLGDLAHLARDRGVRIADHRLDDDVLDCGVDPARILADGGDPAEILLRMDQRVASCRLSDVSGGARILPLIEGGTLDVGCYRSAMERVGYQRAVVLDLAHVRGGLEGAPGVLRAWAMGERAGR